MSAKSNNYGRAYEFACLQVLAEILRPFREVSVEVNSSYEAAAEAWKKVPKKLQANLLASSRAAVEVLLDCEALLTEGTDALSLNLQTDTHGEEGDVRDIIVARRASGWEIGLSLKHNHKAVKHSRLATTLDFGEKWYGIACSQSYWAAIEPIFKRLNAAKEKGTLWREMKDKGAAVYKLLLAAFMAEVKQQALGNPVVARRLAEYLLGTFDFYKVVSQDREEATYVTPYNLRGNLNKVPRNSKPKIQIEKTDLPKQILACDFIGEHNNKIFMAMDNGWQFTFRLHNASSRVEPSLKFDIQLTGWPITLVTIKRLWVCRVGR